MGVASAFIEKVTKWWWFEQRALYFRSHEPSPGYKKNNIVRHYLSCSECHTIICEKNAPSWQRANNRFIITSKAQALNCQVIGTKEGCRRKGGKIAILCLFVHVFVQTLPLIKANSFPQTTNYVVVAPMKTLFPVVKNRLPLFLLLLAVVFRPSLLSFLKSFVSP